LALLAGHQPDANLQTITRAFQRWILAKNPVDKATVWKSVCGYTNHVAKMVNLKRLYKVVPMPPRPEGEPSSETSEV
jgi:hypothetical protein